jgi:amphi-Trp domain-containing protein
MSSSNGDKKSVAYEGQLDLSKALDYLKSLQAALKKGTAYVQNGTEVVALEPESSVNMQVEAKSKKEKQSIKIEISWERAEEEIETSSGSLTISETEPDLVAVIEEDDD